jgi:RDD family
LRVAVTVSRAAYTLAWRRTAAWVVDWLIISVYATALVPVGLLLVDRSVRLPSLGWNAVSFVVLIVPVTVWLAAWEGGRSAATPRKHLLRLRVRVPREGDVGWRRAAVRNALKVALPWELGHTAAFLLADSKASGSTVLVGMASAVLACPLAAGYLTALFIGTGRTPYDYAAATYLVRLPAVETSSATRVEHEP